MNCIQLLFSVGWVPYPVQLRSVQETSAFFGASKSFNLLKCAAIKCNTSININIQSIKVDLNLWFHWTCSNLFDFYLGLYQHYIVQFKLHHWLHKRFEWDNTVCFFVLNQWPWISIEPDDNISILLFTLTGGFINNCWCKKKKTNRPNTCR